LPVRKKRKILIQEEEENLIENGIQRFSLDDVELEVDIEKIFPAMEQPEISCYFFLQTLYLFDYHDRLLQSPIF
jgi:hypothetical protein